MRRVEDEESHSFSETNHTTNNQKRLDSLSDSEDYDDIRSILGDPDRVRAKKISIMKNLLLICFAFMCNFTAFNGTSSLQSSLNYEEGLGTASLAIIYGALIVSAMFLPTVVINKLGCKWTICASIVGYVTYSLANFKPLWYTLVPSSIIVGLSAAPLWSAKCTYLTIVAKKYAVLTDETADTVTNRFFGIFFLFFQFTNIIGQIISSFVLSSGDIQNLQFPTCHNETYIKEYCGANDCQDDFNAARVNYNSSSCPVSDLESENLQQTTLYTLMGIYSAIGLFGAGVVASLVDPIQIRRVEERGKFDLVIATFQHMKDYRQLLLIPITMYSGFEQATMTGDVTRSFVTCPLAVNWVGIVLICYGACDSIFSFIFGRAEKYTGRVVLFTGAAMINVAVLIVFLVWVPYPTSPVLFFLLPSFWGISDAVWQTQLNAFYGVLFKGNQEASFANYRLWESLGFVISFAYQNFLCVNIKLYVTLSMLVLGMTLYYYVEYGEKKSKNLVEDGQEGSSASCLETSKREADSESYRKEARISKI